jgi:hypothetical protein
MLAQSVQHRGNFVNAADGLAAAAFLQQQIRAAPLSALTVIAPDAIRTRMKTAIAIIGICIIG